MLLDGVGNRIGLHPDHMQGLYARIALLPAPDEGLYDMPRIHMVEVRICILRLLLTSIKKCQSWLRPSQIHRSLIK